MKKNNQPSGALLVGSVPLEDNTAVFNLASSLMGQHLNRIPDGETGKRTNWVNWQFNVLANTPQLEPVTHSTDEYGNLPRQVKLCDGISANDIEFGPLGYSAAAIASYAEFEKLKEAGNIPKDCRFQVSLPTPFAPIHFYVAENNREAIEPIYEAKLLEELDTIIATIPSSELAIQWDTAVEFGIIEGVFPTFLSDIQAGILERLVHLGNAVPTDVELGYHLCYGDSGHKHFVEPEDTKHLVTIANGIASGINRNLNWIHLPVPQSRNDEAYYLPLKNLALHSGTELYLGLVHDSDGVEGTQKRIGVAKSIVGEFGVATECGFGRRPSETIPDLMQLHVEVSSIV